MKINEDHSLRPGRSGRRLGGFISWSEIASVGFEMSYRFLIATLTLAQETIIPCTARCMHSLQVGHKERFAVKANADSMRCGGRSSEIGEQREPLKCGSTHPGEIAKTGWL